MIISKFVMMHADVSKMHVYSCTILVSLKKNKHIVSY